MYPKYRIYPPIGIARVGDSPDYYLGPEAPQLNFLPPQEPGTDIYRDEKGRIKRMGAGVRIYEFENGVAIREITLDENDVESIEWDVHLVNSKAAYGSLNPGIDLKDLTIDSSTSDPKKPGQRRPVAIAGRNKGKQPLTGLLKASAPPTEVKLGDILTDPQGRLIVLGGHGKAGTWLADNPPSSIHNAGWWDDTSDGKVRARIRLKGSDEVFHTESAWVLVGPPDYAHAVEAIVTLYDLVLDRCRQFVFEGGIPVVSFTKHIYPVLRRTAFMRWTSSAGNLGHGANRPQLEPETMFRHMHTKGGPEAAQARQVRKYVFARLKEPGNPTGGTGNMPGLSNLTLTPLQYEWFRLWSSVDDHDDDQFVDDWDNNWDPFDPPQPAFDQIAIEHQPEALTRAALDACVGGSFSPGLESGGTMADTMTYEDLFRISRLRNPGDLTQQLGVPWQSDFIIYCGESWWPSARPGQVLVKQSDGGIAEKRWTRNVPNEEVVKKWSQLGFIVKDDDPAQIRYIETSRTLPDKVQ